MSTSLAGPEDVGALAGDDPVGAAPSHHDLRERAFRAHGGDWGEACRAWASLREHAPDDLDGYAFGIGALCEHGDRVGAQLVADEAVRVFGEDRRILTERALICFYTRDWPEARKRFALLRQRYPDQRVGYTRGVEVAENMGDRAEAFAVMDAARKHLPDDAELVVDATALAERLADPARAAAGWGEQRRRSGEERAYVGEGRSLAEAGREEAADEVLREGLRRFPASVALAAEHARLASRGAHWSDVVARWAPLVELPELAEEAASRLRDADYVTASASAVAASVTQPGAGAVGRPLGELLAKRWTLRFGYGQVLGQNVVLGRGGELLNFYGGARSWELRDNAVCLLDERRYCLAKLSDIARGEDGRLRLTGRDCHHPTIQSVLILEEQRPTIQAVMSDFESLGDNCEFGLVQRFFQAEPLGLLRFNWTAFDSLVAGLGDDFSEIDKPDCVRVTRVGDGELIGHLDAYGFVYHTGRYNQDVDFAKFGRSEAGRLRYLADKLIEDVESGDKIFVRKGETAADIDRIDRLHEAIRKRGAATTLLWVTEADAAHPAGTVEAVRDGLLRGYIDALAPYDAAARASYAGWEEICVRAHRLARPDAWGH